MEAKDRYNLTKRLRRANDPEQARKLREQAKARYQDPEVKQKAKDRAKARRERLKKENPNLLYEKEKASRDKMKATGKDRGYKNDYRAKKMDAYIEAVNFKVVFERDKGVCHICGTKTRRNFTKGKQPSNYATLDHVIPLNKGGLHCYENVKIACKSCNSEKSDRIPTEGIQMSLFAQPGVTKRVKESTAHLPIEERKKIWQQRYREKNRDKINESNRNRRDRKKILGIPERKPDPEVSKAYFKAYYEKNREKKRAYDKARYLEVLQNKK